MRSKIEANEYKDYILGFIFYKFLSDREVEYLKKNDWEDGDLPELVEEDKEVVEQCRHTETCFQHGSVWGAILMHPM